MGYHPIAAKQRLGPKSGGRQTSPTKPSSLGAVVSRPGFDPAAGSQRAGAIGRWAHPVTLPLAAMLYVCLKETTMNRALLAATFVAIGSLSLSACVIAPDAPVRTPDGLVKIANAKVDSVYAAPGMSLARYRRVMLDSIDVAFKADWQQRHPEISADEVAMIRHGAESVFRAEFAKELEKGGYSMASQPGPDVLRVAASIVDLDFAASTGASADKPAYVVSPADMSLLAELRDSQSGAMIARVADRKSGRGSGNLQVADQAAYTAEARAAFTRWASLLREALDAARKAPGPG